MDPRIVLYGYENSFENLSILNSKKKKIPKLFSVENYDQMFFQYHTKTMLKIERTNLLIELF